MNTCQCNGDKGDVTLNGHFIIESISTANTRWGEGLQLHIKVSGYTILKGLKKVNSSFTIRILSEIKIDMGL